MDVKKTVISLLLGIAGGFIAFFIADSLKDKQVTPEIRHEIVGPGIKSVAYRPEPENTVGGAGSVDLREAAKKSVPGVVHVKTMQMRREFVGNSLLDFWFGTPSQSREVPMAMGYGSGVIISDDGYIITNNHVIKDADKIVVVLNDKKEYEAKLIGQDPITDIALLKIDGKNLAYVEYGNSDEVALGEWVLAVGNPYNLTSTVTAGIISAKARDLGMSRGQMSLESFLQTDAAINPGNSGGALVNAKGELIGINTLIQSPTGAYSGYAFAIPVNIARKVVTDLKDYGKVQRGVLGIRMGELTPVLAEGLGVKETSGIYVGEVVSGGAAQKAGIKKGDIIQGINGIDVKTTPEFYEQLGKYHPGSEIQLKIKRGGQEKLVDVTLQNSYGDTALEQAQEFGVLGVKVSPLTKEDRYRYRLNKGVKITEIQNGKFKAAGLDKGYIIVKINNNVIYDQEDLSRAISSVGDNGVFVTAVSPRGKVEYFAFSLLN
ncbi:Do family serine endopeptidase [Culturomica massiliensis]|uniref:Do family serine endopeptidase n=1 Tax=Culturomica massiliensis TaxID=1841857 RepID=UPI00266EBC2D|nr:Do family serine endopeptidase [Culturomica massiliensis]